MIKAKFFSSHLFLTLPMYLRFDFELPDAAALDTAETMRQWAMRKRRIFKVILSRNTEARTISVLKYIEPTETVEIDALTINILASIPLNEMTYFKLPSVSACKAAVDLAKQYVEKAKPEWCVYARSSQRNQTVSVMKYLKTPEEIEAAVEANMPKKPHCRYKPVRLPAITR